MATTPKDIEKRQEELNKLYAEVFGNHSSKPTSKPDSKPTTTLSLSDTELIDKAMDAKNGAKFKALWDGDKSGYGDDDSAADMALCGMLAFWTDKNHDRIDVLFRQSGLYQDPERAKKWSRRTGEQSYGDLTIERAIEKVTATYKGNVSKKTTNSPLPSPKEIYVDDTPLPQDKVEPFPVEIMPGCLKDLITQGAKSSGCPPDFIAVFALVSLGSAIGNKVSVQIKLGWEIKPNIYLGLVAKTGTGKTPAQRIATTPMKELQKIMAKEYGEEFKKYERRVAEWEVKCAEAKKNGEVKPPKEEEPFMDEIYTSDATVEALAQMLERNPQGITIVLDELTAWLNGLDQYKGGKGADQEAFLSLWSGVTTKINRKGKPPIIIDKPFLSVMGSLPPSMLKTLTNEKGRGENGFIHRILFSYPDPVKQEWTEDIISPEVLTEYYNLFMRLRGMTTQTMTLSTEAYKLWIEYYNDFQAEKNGPDFPENLHGPWAKMDQQLAKIALIIHCVRLALKETSSEKIDEVSMSAAGSIINYFQSHALRVYSQLTENEEDKQFRQIIAWTNKHSKKEVTAREILRAKLCKNIEEVIILFNIMQKHQIGTIGEEKVRGGKTIKFVFGV